MLRKILMLALMLAIPAVALAGVNDLTVKTLTESGRKVLGTDSILVAVQGNGTTPDGDRFVNDEYTYIILHSKHTATVVFKVAAPVATIQTGYGALTVPEIVITLAIGSTNVQMTVVKIPVLYNVSGKILIKATSSSDLTGNVKIAAVKLFH